MPHGKNAARKNKKFKIKWFNYCTKTNRPVTCMRCHREFKPEGLTTDHIIPIIHGGVDNQSNMQVLCYECHRIKDKVNKSKQDYRPKIFKQITISDSNRGIKGYLKRNSRFNYGS